MNPETELARASVLADEHRASVEAIAKRAHDKWASQSRRREQANGLLKLLGHFTGRVDENYTAEVPLVLGWDAYDNAPSLVYVALGGVDVSCFLPPEIMAEIRRHIESSFEDEVERGMHGKR
jgi:hypothetical protein